MTQAERDNRLKELNEKCMKCREDSINKGFEPPNHKLENPEWDKQDWNSSKLEGLYHN